MSALAPEPQLLPARARTSPIDFGARAGQRAHQVLTDPHTGPAEQALCGARALHGWVLLPVNVDDCPRCTRAERTDSGVVASDRVPAATPAATSP